MNERVDYIRPAPGDFLVAGYQLVQVEHVTPRRAFVRLVKLLEVPRREEGSWVAVNKCVVHGNPRTGGLWIDLAGAGVIATWNPGVRFGVHCLHWVRDEAAALETAAALVDTWERHTDAVTKAREALELARDNRTSATQRLLAQRGAGEPDPIA
jgi:hypothetical protein